MQEMQEMQVRFLSWEDPLEEDNSPQCFCLENPMDRGAWRATILQVTKSWTQPSNKAQQQTSCDEWTSCGEEEESDADAQGDFQFLNPIDFSSQQLREDPES